MKAREAMKARYESKWPFISLTRNIANMCFCAACGAAARSSDRLPDGNGYAPSEWSTQNIDYDGERVPVYTCVACTHRGVSGQDAREFFDRHNLTWSLVTRSWSASPAAR